MNFSKYEYFTLSEDLNPIITAGMKGVVLEIYNSGEAYEVEFVKTDGTNYEFCSQSTFTVRPEVMSKLSGEEK